MTLRLIFSLSKGTTVETDKPISVEAGPKIKLVRIYDRAQTDYCQVCGTTSEILFWNGFITKCIPCDKGKNIAKKFGITTPSPGLSLAEFMQVFVERYNKSNCLSLDQYLEQLSRQAQRVLGA